jgi:transcriptional regulator with XRE-family HTH domain
MLKLPIIRQRRGLSQRALAEIANVGHITIARLETGVYDPRLSTLRRLAKALNVRVRDLLDE